MRYASQPAQQFYVSQNGRDKGKASRFPTYDHRGGGNTKHYASMQSPTQRIIVDTSDEAEDLPTYTYIKPKARSSHKQKKSASANANFFFNQESRRPEPSDSQPQKSRARRSSQSANVQPTIKKVGKPPPSPPQATKEDAAQAGIPAGYSIKNWDPTETPILLLGSAFDSDSLGRWIYDWTVYHHGAATPIAAVAGDLWVLLIRLAVKTKRAEECLPRVRGSYDLDLVKDFLISGQSLWTRFKELLKTCEDFMWKAAKREGSKGTVKMGKHSGCEFVDTMFGRDREMEETEALMQRIRHWTMNFDAKCDEVLK